MPGAFRSDPPERLRQRAALAVLAAEQNKKFAEKCLKRADFLDAKLIDVACLRALAQEIEHD